MKKWTKTSVMGSQLYAWDPHVVQNIITKKLHHYIINTMMMEMDS
jgi:hypothetical protein